MISGDYDDEELLFDEEEYKDAVLFSRISGDYDEEEYKEDVYDAVLFKLSKTFTRRFFFSQLSKTVDNVDDWELFRRMGKSTSMTYRQCIWMLEYGVLLKNGADTTEFITTDEDYFREKYRKCEENQELLSEEERENISIACTLSNTTAKSAFFKKLCAEFDTVEKLENLWCVGDLYGIWDGYPIQKKWLNEYREQLKSNGFIAEATAPTHNLPKINDAGKQKYFDAAVRAGFMEETDTGYKWRYPQNNPSKARLGYFISKIYRNESTPIKYLEGLFGVTRLDVAIYAERKFTQKWEEEINTIIDNVKACND